MQKRGTEDGWFGFHWDFHMDCCSNQKNPAISEMSSIQPKASKSLTERRGEQDGDEGGRKNCSLLPWMETQEILSNVNRNLKKKKSCDIAWDVHKSNNITCNFDHKQSTPDWFIRWPVFFCTIFEAEFS